MTKQIIKDEITRAILFTNDTSRDAFDKAVTTAATKTNDIITALTDALPEEQAQQIFESVIEIITAVCTAQHISTRNDAKEELKDTNTLTN